MLLDLHKRANGMGVLSVLLSLAFWTYVMLPAEPGVSPASPYVVFLVLPGVLAISLISSVAAAILGSRWWSLATLGPLCGAMFLLSLRT